MVSTSSQISYLHSFLSVSSYMTKWTHPSNLLLFQLLLQVSYLHSFLPVYGCMMKWTHPSNLLWFQLLLQWALSSSTYKVTKQYTVNLFGFSNNLYTHSTAATIHAASTPGYTAKMLFVTLKESQIHRTFFIHVFIGLNHPQYFSWNLVTRSSHHNPHDLTAYVSENYYFTGEPLKIEKRLFPNHVNT